MTLLEHELATLSVDRLDALSRSELPGLAAAAKAELDRRPTVETERLRLRRSVFPR